MRAILQPTPGVLFVNTDSVSPLNREGFESGLSVNHLEAVLVAWVIDGASRGGLGGCDMGVITPFRAQAALIQVIIIHASGKSRLLFARVSSFDFA